MNERELVEFIRPALQELAPPFQAELRGELKVVFSDPKRPPLAITVSRSFTGYAPDVKKSVVLGIGVRFEDGFESHIVKIGARAHVQPDYVGWGECTAGRDVASRILHPVRYYELPNDRCAILYRDAYMLFGGGGKTPVAALETAVEWAVKDDDRLDPLSLERVITQIYTDLGRWFYYDSQLEPERARAFYEHKLRVDEQDPLNRVLNLWTTPPLDARPDPVGLRRDAIWLLCGREQPANLDEIVAQYLDPVDYVGWSLAAGTVPEALVGRSHGDLHGLNVLLGVERGEAEYPAVIDYGMMGLRNVIAWDFVMLECELKCRLLPQLYRDAEARERLLKDSRRSRRPENADADDVSDQARRADRLEFAFLFERLLADRTARIHGRDDAERLSPPCERSATRARKLDRLLGILLRIRQEAALVLGYQRNRSFAWRDEYYFTLAVYGVSVIKWEEYEPRAVECALISAGVAAASIAAGQKALKEAMSRPEPGNGSVPSYRVPLFQAHGCWQKGDAKEGLRLLGKYERQFSYAVPLEQERALLLLELGHAKEAQELMVGFQEGCKAFGDHETLSRLGRAYKNAGDRSWSQQYAERPERAGPVLRSPAWQQYREAQTVYENAFELSDSYYPGVNAASLALLVHDTDKAKRLARRVADLCADQVALPNDEMFWLYATEGEAALILGRYDAARTFYRQALDEPSAEPQHVQAAYHQLCRLWHVLEENQVNLLVDDLFAKHPTWSRVQPGPVGGCGKRK